MTILLRSVGLNIPLLASVIRPMIWGILMEYQYDEREDNFFAPAQNDLMVGLRWVLNDQDSTEVLFGVVQDLEEIWLNRWLY